MVGSRKEAYRVISLHPTSYYNEKIVVSTLMHTLGLPIEPCHEYECLTIYNGQYYSLNFIESNSPFTMESYYTR